MPLPVLFFGTVAALDLLAVTLDLTLLEWLTKPLLAPVLLVYLWRATGTRHRLVMAGLALAAAGDVLLMLEGPVTFVVGTACFLGMQTCYISAFVGAGAVGHLKANRRVPAGYLVVWVAVNVALTHLLNPMMTVLVALYSLALVLMAVAAHVLGREAAWGGAVFVASDLLVGLGAAGIEFTGRPALVMITYSAAQFLVTDAFVRTCRGADGDRPRGSRVMLHRP
ncbi:lysoplasmalogenase family protein [Streptomyces coelicoflavus]|uniref:lysoplasmalogenase family protein n=1 Tax=Streptomyces coelicoflavus TaxID=285562 RepID=UPI00363A2723